MCCRTTCCWRAPRPIIKRASGACPMSARCRTNWIRRSRCPRRSGRALAPPSLFRQVENLRGRIDADDETNPVTEPASRGQHKNEGAAEPSHPIKPTVGPRTRGNGSCPTKRPLNSHPFNSHPLHPTGARIAASPRADEARAAAAATAENLRYGRREGPPLVVKTFYSNPLFLLRRLLKKWPNPRRRAKRDHVPS